MLMLNLYSQQRNVSSPSASTRLDKEEAKSQLKSQTYLIHPQSCNQLQRLQCCWDLSEDKSSKTKFYLKFLQKIDKIKSSVITQAQRFQPDNRYSQSLQFCTHFAHHLAHTGPQHTPLIFFTSSHLDKETKFRVSDQDHIGPGLRFGWYKNSLVSGWHTALPAHLVAGRSIISLPCPSFFLLLRPGGAGPGGGGGGPVSSQPRRRAQTTGAAAAAHAQCLPSIPDPGLRMRTTLVWCS